MMHGVRGYFRFAHIDGLITSDPAVYARLPKVHRDESRTHGLDRLELIRFLQVAQTITVHHGALAYLRGINALRASEAAAVRIEDYNDTLRGHRVLHLTCSSPVANGSSPLTRTVGEPGNLSASASADVSTLRRSTVMSLRPTVRIASPRRSSATFQFGPPSIWSSSIRTRVLLKGHSKAVPSTIPPPGNSASGDSHRQSTSAECAPTKLRLSAAIDATALREIRLVGRDRAPPHVAPRRIADDAATLLGRSANPNIRHLLNQTAAEGHQKMPMRILQVLRAEVEAGEDIFSTIRPLAAWIAHTRGAGAPLQDSSEYLVRELVADSVKDAVNRVLDDRYPGKPRVCSALLEEVPSSLRDCGAVIQN